MRKLLVKILWSNHSKSNLIAAAFGMLLGFVIILSSVQIYFDIQEKIVEQDQVFKPDFIIINKKISLLNTLKVANSNFSSTDILELKKQVFIQKVGKFVSNKFKLGAFTSENSSVPSFYTELFFESVEDEYLEIKNKDWTWNESDNTIPIILPKDYLTLYNFGFAQSQGLPQITEDIIGKSAFNLRIQGNGKTVVYKGRIVGFSNKINSVLVPYKFLSWANSEFGETNDSTSASRLVVLLKNPTDIRANDYFEAHDIETDTKNDKVNKLAALLKMITSIVSIVGLTIILLSVMVFVLSFNLLIAKSAESITKLIHLGLHYNVVLKLYAKFYLLILTSVLMFSFGLLFIVKYYVNSSFRFIGFNFDTFPHFLTFFIGISLAILMFVINSISLKKSLKSLTN